MRSSPKSNATIVPTRVLMDMKDGTRDTELSHYSEVQCSMSGLSLESDPYNIESSESQYERHHDPAMACPSPTPCIDLAYRLFDPIHNKLLISRDVTFNESQGWTWEETSSAVPSVLTRGVEPWFDVGPFQPEIEAPPTESLHPEHEDLIFEDPESPPSSLPRKMRSLEDIY
ncbi:hypothetical protein KSP39_PZI018395 [Platanthera zijinensis]|uniref:Retroviral polymerase SH3-like domain-containing protein n=1 Tax=Platanthera zijinensis TaxID=2320716 RepID=A0AAP0FZ41_9ASPA